MQRYIIRRLLLAVPTLFLITILVFGMMRMLPGDTLMVMLGETAVNMPISDLNALKKELGFDKPLHIQYINFITKAVRGDLGVSLHDRQPVLGKIVARIPVTLELALLSLTLSFIIAIPIGVIAAVKQDSLLDYLLRGGAIGFDAIPRFWLATLAVLLPAIWFNWLPPVIYVPITKDPISNLTQMMLPAFILGIGGAASTMRYTRAMMLEVLRQDYIRTAWSKGLAQRIILQRHALRNAMIPVVTVMGLQIAFLFGGTVIMESIFSLPGMGRLLLDAINFRDYPIIQGINLIAASWLLFVNIAVDVSYGFIDPRVRYR